MPTLKVFVNEAADLFGADLDGKSDPYCVLKIGEGNQFSAIEKTRKIKNTKNPTWKECFTLNVNNPLTESLFLEVWNKEKSKDDSLGYAQIPLHDLQRNVEKQVWVQLEGGTTGSNIIGSIASHLGKKKGEKTNHGKVFLGLTALDFGIDPNFAQQQFQQGMGMHQGMPMQQGMGMPGMQQQGMGQGMQPGIGTQHCATHGIHDQCHSGNMQQQGMGQGMGMQQPGMQQGFQPGMGQGMQQPGMQQQGMGQGMGMQQPGMQQGFQPGMGQGVHQHPISSGGHEGTKSKEGVPIHPPSSGGVQGSKGEHGASIHPPSSGGLEGSKRVNTPQVPSTTATSTTTHPPGVLKPESQYHGTAQDL